MAEHHDPSISISSVEGIFETLDAPRYVYEFPLAEDVRSNVLAYAEEAFNTSEWHRRNGAERFRPDRPHFCCLRYGLERWLEENPGRSPHPQWVLDQIDRENPGA